MTFLSLFFHVRLVIEVESHVSLKEVDINYGFMAVKMMLSDYETGR